MHIREFIEKNYPEYYSIERYPKDRTAPFCSVDQSWGILSNFGRTPLVVDGIPFDCAEKLFQVMKFADDVSRKASLWRNFSIRQNFIASTIISPQSGRTVPAFSKCFAFILMVCPLTE